MAISWWRHQMETFSALLAICAGNSPVPGEFSAQRPVTRSFDVFFDLRLSNCLSKQSWGWWFETLSCPWWRHCNVELYHIFSWCCGDAFLPAFVICISIFKLESKITPKFRADVTCVIWFSPTWMNGLLTRSSCCLLPTIKNYVLLSFTINMLEIIQPLSSATQFPMPLTEAVGFVEGMRVNDR